MSSEKASGALSGAASGAAAGTAILPGWGTAIGAVVGGIGGLLASKGTKAPATKLIDIPSVVDQARTQARQNALDSIALEREADPATANLRLRSNDFLRDSITGQQQDPNLARRDALLAQLQGAAGQSLGPGVGSAGRNGPVEDINGANAAKRDSLIEGLIKAASNKDPSAESLSREGSAQVLNDLRLGGQLDAETQAAVARSSLEASGDSGILGSLAGRGLTARDLGLTTLQLRQARQDRANQLGMALTDRQTAAEQANANFVGQAYGQDLQTHGQKLDAGFQSRAQDLTAHGLDLQGYNLMLQQQGDQFDRLATAANAAEAAGGNDFTRRFGVAQLIDNRQRPVAGLDPAAVADLNIANVNAQNQMATNGAAISAASRNANMQAAGSLLGTVASLYAGRKAPGTVSSGNLGSLGATK